MTWTSTEYQLAAAVADGITAGLTKKGLAVPVAVIEQPRTTAEGIQSAAVEVMPAAWTSPDTWRDVLAEEITVHVCTLAPADPNTLGAIDAGLALAGAVRKLWTPADDEETPALWEILAGWTFKPPAIQAPLWQTGLAANARLFAALLQVTYQAP